ncbi:TPA: ZPR1 zinc finger domain-containing protein [Candidatus Woesearchaeota archaeon]|nr:ZPR1 zinc finger domain-containing protein [Candidatus Woesearchaeota archaeon]
MTKKDPAGKQTDNSAQPEGTPTKTQHDDFDYETIEGELCPFCNEKTLTLMETARDIPFFGVCHIFSMDCSNCKYHKADVEAENATGEPVKYTLDISEEADMKIRVIKSSEATVKLAYIGEIEPGETANGYITNVEGLLNRMKQQIEHLKKAAQEGDEADEETATKCKNMLKKLTRILWGQEPLKITISDPSGNSAIISEKAEKKRL